MESSARANATSALRAYLAFCEIIDLVRKAIMPIELVEYSFKGKANVRLVASGSLEHMRCNFDHRPRTEPNAASTLAQSISAACA
jgi:hypothetical protein